MKTGRITEIIKSTSNYAYFIIVLFTIVYFSSCRRPDEKISNGTNGYPGKAFLSVNWDVSKPDYLDVGTSDIPSVFEWGTYYRTYPSINTLYYDGQVWMGSYWADYNWEVDYEVYVNLGEQGGPNYNGRDGLNSYFDIICTPTGPDITSYDARIKPNDNPNDINSTPEIITIIKRDGNYSIKITYKKVKLIDNHNQSKVPVDKTTSSAK